MAVFSVGSQFGVGRENEKCRMKNEEFGSTELHKVGAQRVLEFGV